MPQLSLIMENEYNRHWNWHALTALKLLAMDIVENRMPLFSQPLMGHAQVLVQQLITDLKTSIENIPEAEHNERAAHLHHYLEGVRMVSNQLHTYRNLIHKRDAERSNMLDEVCQKMLVVTMTIAVYYPNYDPLESLVHDYLITLEMHEHRRNWHYIHQQLIQQTSNTDIKLVAMNVIRECRPSQHKNICWRRLAYNHHMLELLSNLLHYHDRATQFDQVLIDSLLHWEYYDDDFICYYIQYIEKSLEIAASSESKKNVLAQFYTHIEKMRPTNPAFCFSVATEESDSLPPVKMLLMQILNFHSESMENK
ncbi:hypothetical protein HNQ91_006062 [Filimonas zeae]|nr:hypothetical protein [Filimonas zeae]MDR6342975.1 hypothetical protein [Filimonas zeae]